MDCESWELAARLVPKTYIIQSKSAIASRQRLIRSLLSQRRLPDQGWDELNIELLLRESAEMDSNNFIHNVGVGEREARVACPIVERRCFNLAHGVGRSGDISAVQPKAAGSSLLAKLASCLAADALRLAGLQDVSAATILPLATGMALTSSLLALKRLRPEGSSYVLWPSVQCRIDQKTCVKCITAAGLKVVVIPNIQEGDQLVTDLVFMEQKIKELHANSIVAVLSTTSCFAPRAADRLVEIAKLCKKFGIGHIVNNAYGVQAAKLCALVTSAWRKGRVDAVVQSTDKNFMVPVGGSIVAAGPGGAKFIQLVNGAYPGRASAAPMLDLLITLLYWGASGWKKVLQVLSLTIIIHWSHKAIRGARPSVGTFPHRCGLQDREELYEVAKKKVQEFADMHGCRLLDTPDNPISMALALDNLVPLNQVAVSASEKTDEHVSTQIDDQPSPHIATASNVNPRLDEDHLGIQSREITFLGSMLFQRGVSGTRVIGRGNNQIVEDICFQGYGAHCDAFPYDYLTLAVAIGTKASDIDEFLNRLGKCFAKF